VAFCRKAADLQDFGFTSQKSKELFMRKREFAIFTIIFPALIFASCDTNPSPDGVIHVNNESEWVEALSFISNAPNGNAGSSNVFVINMSGNFSVNGIEDAGSSSIGGIYKKVRMTGGGTMSLASNGNLIRTAENQTFIIDGPTLQGKDGNDTALVYIAGNSTVELLSGYIKNNNNNIDDGFGGGVCVVGGNFTMNGGVISGNSVDQGGGVFLGGGNFTMSDGVISNNECIAAAGVFVNSGMFLMTGGEISSNHANTFGGGVGVNSMGSFSMTGGVIYGTNAANSLKNTASTGAAVYISSSGIAKEDTITHYP
jgi:hypothetical protein